MLRILKFSCNISLSSCTHFCCMHFFPELELQEVLYWYTLHIQATSIYLTRRLQWNLQLSLECWILLKVSLNIYFFFYFKYFFTRIDTVNDSLKDLPSVGVHHSWHPLLLSLSYHHYPLVLFSSSHLLPLPISLTSQKLFILLPWFIRIYNWKSWFV